MSENIGHEKRWLILGIMSLSLVIVMLNNVTLNVALPEMSKDLQADNSDLQWIVDSRVLCKVHLHLPIILHVFLFAQFLPP